MHVSIPLVAQLKGCWTSKQGTGLDYYQTVAHEPSARGRIVRYVQLDVSGILQGKSWPVLEKFQCLTHSRNKGAIVIHAEEEAVLEIVDAHGLPVELATDKDDVQVWAPLPSWHT